MEVLIHGGDIYRNRVYMDFSVNVNPLGIPMEIREVLHEAVEQCQGYPDIKSEELIHKIAQKEEVPASMVLCGNGASELFMAIVHGIKPKKVLIPVPSFYGYEWAAQAEDAEVEYYEMEEERGLCIREEIMEHLTETTNLLFLANPNNPVGNLIGDDFLVQVCEECRKKEIYVVLDECFLDFTGAAGFFQKQRPEDFPNVIVVRAFTKLYAIPGVRLGYLLSGNKKLMDKIQHQLPEWNISIFAQRAGVAAIEMTDFLKRTVEFLKKEKEYLEEHLRRMGIYVYPGEADYLLLQTEMPLYRILLKQGILIRDCSNYRGLKQGFYRIAVKNHSENKVLIQTLERWCENERN